MIRTGLSQMRFAWSQLSGRRLHGRDITALACDMRDTLERFGTLGQDAEGMLAPAADPELQADLARRRLRGTVRRAAAETPYYRALFADLGLDPATVTPDTFRTIPPTPKAALRGTPAAFVSDRAQPTTAAQTTGTTGVPTTVWFSRREVEVLAATSAMALMLGGFRSNHVWANCVSSRALPSVITSRSVELTGGAFIQLGLIDPRDALDRLATPLHLPGKEPQITHLNVVASYLGALVQQIERGDWSAEDFGLRQIRVGGEVLTEALSRRAAAAFGAEIVEGYAMTETLPVNGMVCRAGHLHTAPDQGHVEILDPVTREPAAPGTVGEVVVTPYALYRDTTMLLRYATGDLVRVLTPEEQPACELATLPATSKLLGRQSASAVSTRDILEILQSEPGVELPTRYAVDDEDGLLYAVADTDDASLVARLEQRLAEQGLPLRGVRLVEDPAKLPAPCPVRADLREYAFGRPTPSMEGVR